MVAAGVTLSSCLVAACGLWSGAVFSGLWFVGFFVVGLSVHGLFYASACPVFYMRKEDTNAHPARMFVGTVWFLQVPFAPFTGMCMWHSVLITQSLVILVTIVLVVVDFAYSRKRGRGA